MTRLLPALHEGHAPIHLHHAFADALAAYEEWGLNMDEPRIAIDGQDVPISSIFGRMRTCTDILPVRLLDDVRSAAGKDHGALEGDQIIYAEAARLLRSLCVDRLRDDLAA